MTPEFKVDDNGRKIYPHTKPEPGTVFLKQLHGNQWAIGHCQGLKLNLRTVEDKKVVGEWQVCITNGFEQPYFVVQNELWHIGQWHSLEDHVRVFGKAPDFLKVEADTDTDNPLMLHERIEELRQSVEDRLERIVKAHAELEHSVARLWERAESFSKRWDTFKKDLTESIKKDLAEGIKKTQTKKDPSPPPTQPTV